MVYFCLIFVCIISSFLKKNQVDNIAYRYILLGVIIFVISSGYMCGTDWRNYELMYEEFGKEASFEVTDWTLEPFYILLNKIFNRLNVGFWMFFIFIKLCVSIILFKSLRQICPTDKFYLSLLSFLSFFGFFMLIDNPMRNVIAVAITLTAMPYLYKGKIINYLFIVFIAFLFHYSAIFMLLIYPIIRSSISNKKWFFVYIFVNVIFVKPDILFQIADFVLVPFPFLSWKVDSYMDQLDTVAKGKLFSLGLLVHLVFFILILNSRKVIEMIPNGKYIFNLAVLFPIVFRMGLTSLVFSRFQLYLSLFYVVAISCTVSLFNIKSRIFYKIYVITISVCSCYQIVTSDYRYIPYTNYFVEKMFGKEYLYDERSNYNKIYSPYKDKIVFEK